jgi:hypothetical protein
MRQLNGVYTQGFNKRHDRVGHLFQGRFKAILVERESHLLELIRYVVLNPVRVGFVRTPHEWKWSSFPATAGLEASPPWLETGWTLEQFGTSRRKAVERYRDFVGAEAALSYQPWESLEGQIYIGSKEFRQEAEERVRELVLPGVPRWQLRPARPTAEEIAKAIESVIGPFSPKRGGRSKERRLYASLMQTEGLLPYAAMIEHLGVGAWAASRLAREGGVLARHGTEFGRLAAKVRERLRGGPGKTKE